MFYHRPLEIINILNISTFLKNWDSLYVRLNSYYEAWSYKKKKRKNIKAYRESV